jgi:ankyrin repeat protein
VGRHPPPSRRRASAVESGADVNRQDVLGSTALIVAAGNGDLPMLEMLLRAGADARLCDDDGNMAQAWAAHGNHADAVRLLQEWASAQPSRDVGGAR